MYQSVHSAKLLCSVGRAACLVLNKTPKGKVQVQSLLKTFKELLLCAEVWPDAAQKEGLYPRLSLGADFEEQFRSSLPRHCF